jgi:hypothetical protein
MNRRVQNNFPDWDLLPQTLFDPDFQVVARARGSLSVEMKIHYMQLWRKFRYWTHEHHDAMFGAYGIRRQYLYQVRAMLDFIKQQLDRLITGGDLKIMRRRYVKRGTIFGGTTFDLNGRGREITRRRKVWD